MRFRHLPRANYYSVSAALIALASLLAIGARASASTLIQGQLWFTPPVNTAADSSHNGAVLTQDWHSSKLSGDPDAVGACTPGSKSFPSYCTALDWNDGSGAVGDPAYFRAFGVWTGTGSSTGYATADVSAQQTTTCGSGTSSDPRVTIHYMTITIKNAVGIAIGKLVFQHVKPTVSHVTLSFGSSSAPYFNNVQIGTLTSDVGTSGVKNTNCWTGPHLHEDDAHDATTNDSQWSWDTAKTANGYAFQGNAGKTWLVNYRANWTRLITWFQGCASCGA